MIYQSTWTHILFILVVCLLSACASKPRVEIYMESLTARTESRINVRTAGLTVEKRGVTVTVEPRNEVELFESMNTANSTVLYPMITSETCTKM